MSLYNWLILNLKKNYTNIAAFFCRFTLNEFNVNLLCVILFGILYFIINYNTIITFCDVIDEMNAVKAAEAKKEAEEFHMFLQEIKKLREGNENLFLKKLSGVEINYSTILEDAMSTFLKNSIIHYSDHAVKHHPIYWGENPACQIFWDFYVWAYYSWSPKERIVLCYFWHHYGQEYNLTYNELGILFRYRRFYIQQGVTWDVTDWLDMLIEYTAKVGDYEDLPLLLDVCDRYFTSKKFDASEDSEFFKGWVRVKKLYDMEVYLTDVAMGSFRTENKVFWLHVHELMKLHTENLNWTFPQLIFVKLECPQISIDIFKEHFRGTGTRYVKLLKHYEKHEIFERQSMTLREILLLYRTFYSNWPPDDFINILLIQERYPNTLGFFRAIKNTDPSLNFNDMMEILTLDRKYNQHFFSRWWYTFTGRRYSVSQLIEIYKLLQTETWKNNEADLIQFVNSHFSSFYEKDDTGYKYLKHNKKWWPT